MASIRERNGKFNVIYSYTNEKGERKQKWETYETKAERYSSTLTEVPGVGPKTAKALMAQFKSVGAVKEATPDQLENTPGVGRQMAQTIYEYFHPQG